MDRGQRPMKRLQNGSHTRLSGAIVACVVGVRIAWRFCVGAEAWGSSDEEAVGYLDQSACRFLGSAYGEVGWLVQGQAVFR